MAELADAPDLGSGGKSRAGSSPVIRTRKKHRFGGAFFNEIRPQRVKYLPRKC